jgi:hypothetical protein
MGTFTLLKILLIEKVSLEKLIPKQKDVKLVLEPKMLGDGVRRRKLTVVLRSTSYTLRAGAPTPLKGECATLDTPAPATIGFVLQTFKAEKQNTDSCEDQTQLLCSNDMKGLGGNFVSASYTAQRFLDADSGGIVFQSTETRFREIVEESEVPGAGNL